jgi:hypothetical protein
VADVSKKLPLDLEGYRKVVVDRDMFADYAPPPKQGRQGVDPARLTVLIGIPTVDGVPRAWFYQRARDLNIERGEGEKFDIDTKTWTVIRIDQNEVEVQDPEGKRRVLSAGDRLRGDETGDSRSAADRPLFTPR